MISIITPVYNCMQWLTSTVESVMGQTYTNWELILIDDGSSDNSLEVMEKLASRDSRIRCKGMNHKGVAGVRNMGLDMARGNYIFFLDADDLIPDYTLEYLHYLISGNDRISIAGGKIVRFDDDDYDESKILSMYSSVKYNINNKESASYRKGVLKNIKLFTAEEGVRQSLYQTGFEASLCGKIFRRSCFCNQHFREGEYYEDLDIFYKLVFNGDLVINSDIPVYLYRQRKGSITHTFNDKRLVVLDITKRICDYMEEKYPNLLPAAIDRRFSANCNMLQLMLKHYSNNDSGYDDKIEETYDYISRNALRELKNPDIRLKNRIGALGILLAPRRLLFMLLKKYMKIKF